MIAALALSAACGPATTSDGGAVTIVTVPPAPSASAGEDRAEVAPRRAPPAATTPRDASIEDRVRARALYVEAIDAQQRGDLRRARELFTQAYALVPKPPMLERLADCEMQLGDMQAACLHLEERWVEGPAEDHPRLLGRYGTTCPHLAQLP